MWTLRSEGGEEGDCRLVGVNPEHLPEFGQSLNIAPQTFQPVFRLSPDTGEREIVLMRWELVPFCARDARDGAKRINARAENIVTTPPFREAIKTRRCLVPADAFYEWQKMESVCFGDLLFGIVGEALWVSAHLAKFPFSVPWVTIASAMKRHVRYSGHFALSGCLLSPPESRRTCCG